MNLDSSSEFDRTSINTAKNSPVRLSLIIVLLEFEPWPWKISKSVKLRPPARPIESPALKSVITSASPISRPPVVRNALTAVDVPTLPRTKISDPSPPVRVSAPRSPERISSPAPQTNNHCHHPRRSGHHPRRRHQYRYQHRR